VPRSSALVPLLLATSLTAGAWTAAPTAQAGGGSSYAVAAGARPERPTGLSPATSGALPVLAWKPVRRAASYEVDVATDSRFRRVIWEVDTVNRRATPTEALPSGRLHWRVRAVNSSGTSRWTTATVTIRANAGPVLLSPSEGEILQQPQGVPLLEWTPVAGADRYEVQVDDEPGFVGAEGHEVGATSFLRRAPQIPGVTYFWRVRAFVDTQVTGWSTTRTYGVQGLRLPQLVAPAMADANAFPAVTDMVLEWTPVPGAASYDVRVSPDREFNTGLVTAETLSTRYSPPVTLGNDQYFWQVRPVDHDGNFATWDMVPRWQFQRSWPSRPELEWPTASSRVTDPMFYQWSAVPHASTYQLQVSTDENFSPANVQTCSTQITTLTPATAGCFPRGGHRTYWRVRALDLPSEVNGLWSPIQEFTYDPAEVQLVAPTDGATVENPSLSWEHMPGASRYTVHIKDANQAVQTYDTHSTSFTPPNLDPALGPFTWYVQANFSTGVANNVPLDFSRSFTLAAPSTTGGTAPTPLTPTGSTVFYRQPALSWTPVANAAYYRVWMSTPNSNIGDFLGDTYAYPAATESGDSRLTAGTYTWFVQAYDVDGIMLSRGAASSFEITRPTAVTGHAVALTGAGLDAADRCTASLGAVPDICSGQLGTAVLGWSAVPEASYYELYLSHDRSMTNLVFPDPVTVPDTRWAWTEQLGDSQAGDAYFWVVRPCVSRTACAAPPTTATHAFDKRSRPISGLTPGAVVDQATGEPSGAVPVVKNQVTLTWSDYLATNQAASNPFTAEPGRQEASVYHLQVATDRNFATVIDDVQVDQLTYTAFGKAYPEGMLYWRVRAVDASANSLPWSSTLVVQKRSPGPELTSPNNGTSIGAGQTLRWSPLAGVAAYEIEIYKDGDQLFSPANRVVADSVGHSAYSPEFPLPASTKAYVWRVRQVDSVGNPGQWSAARTFMVTGISARLVAPQAGGTVAARAALFTWGPAQGATDYVLEVRGARSKATVLEVRTSGLAWAPPTALSRGRYQWRITTVDSSGATMASMTVWRGFEVG